MQQVCFHPARHTKFLVQATYLQPGHGTGTQAEACNDASYQPEVSGFKLLLEVVANVAGGALLLAGMLFLPQLLAELLV